MSHQRFILGVDPGLNTTGYGILSLDSEQPQLIEAGIIGSKREDALAGKLKSIHDGLTDVLNSYPIESVALEELYSHYERPTTAILMGHARGVLCLAIGQKGIPLYSYTATQVKKMLTGNGRAPKEQVQMAIARLMRLPEIPQPPDVADALAIAWCHYYLSQQPASLP